MTDEAWRALDRKEKERLCRINYRKMEAFRDIPAGDWRFEEAGVMTEPLKKAGEYAGHWEEMQKEGLGLLLFGNVGTGKSYAAGCIANVLLEKGKTVLFVSVSDAVNRMQGNFGAERETCLEQMVRPDLLILDDLGAERSTAYGRERVFDIVNRRTLSGKPLIVTTNLSLTAMQNAEDLAERRIYDRILERCVPVLFKGENFRKANAGENLKKAARILSGKGE